MGATLVRVISNVNADDTAQAQKIKGSIIMKIFKMFTSD